MLEQFYLPITNLFLRVVSAIAIFIIALIIGKFAGLIAASLLYELKIDEILETIGIKFFFSKTAGMIVSLAIYVAGFIFALNALGITKIVIFVLAAFFLVLLVIGLFLGIADTTRNFFIGLALRKKYLSKRSVNLETVKGSIIEVGYTRIKVRTKEKDILVVPFSALD